MKTLGIDVKTNNARRIRTNLLKLKTVVSVEGPHMYREDNSYSQLIVETEMSENELEKWLYNGNYDYVGTFEPSPITQEKLDSNV